MLSELVTKEEFFACFEEKGVQLAGFNKEEVQIVNTVVWRETGEVKGGIVEVCDNYDAPTYILQVRFFEDDVQGFHTFGEFDKTCLVNGTTVEYYIKEENTFPEEDVYNYIIKANYKGVNYSLDYLCYGENIMPFLSEFFY